MTAKKSRKKGSSEKEQGRLSHDAALSALADYIRIDTTNPPGNEGPAAEFLASYLEARSLPYQIHKAPDGRPNLVARLSSGEDPSGGLCLMHHMDVVPADESRWTRDPFGGEVVAGEIWGRGALDMKGLGVMHLWAFMHAADRVDSGAARLKRDLVFVAVADEEEGGASGAGWLVSQHPDSVACSELFTEGGFGVASVLPGKDGFACGLTEKAAVWLRLEARGQAGHGGIPPDSQALEKLLACISKLKARNRHYRMAEDVRRLYLALAEHAGGAEKAAMRAAAGRAGRAVLPLIAARLSRAQRALLRDLVTVTMIEAGYKPNVVPGTATATLDCRLLPDTDVDAFIEEVRGIARGYDVTVDVVFRCSPEGTSPRGRLYSLLEEACKKSAPGALFLPSVATGFTDSRFWRSKGVECCGLTPSIIPMELIETMHGDDERLPVEEFRRGLDITRAVVESSVLDPVG